MSEENVDQNADDISSKSRPSSDEIKAFVASKVVQPFCPCCGDNDWQALDEVERGENRPNAHLALVGVGLNGENLIGSPNLPMTMFVCNNCAYVRLHARKLIEILIDKNKDQG